MIEVGRDKADLKAVRESIGISQIDLSEELGVTVRSIKRWEQIGWEEPPERVWELVEDLVAAHEEEVDDLVSRIVADLGDPIASGDPAEAGGSGSVVCASTEELVADGFVTHDAPQPAGDATEEPTAEDDSPAEGEVADVAEQAGGASGEGADEQSQAEPAADADPRKLVYLAYYKNQDHYECFPHRQGTQFTWGNAIVRRAADILRLKGYRVFFYYPEGYQGGED